MLAAGKLRDKVSFYKITSSKTLSGAPVETVQFERNAWAEVIKTANDSSYSQDQQLTIGSYKITIHYSTKNKLIKSYWILYRDKWLKVKSVDDTDPKRNKIILLAEHDDKTPPIINS